MSEQLKLYIDPCLINVYKKYLDKKGKPPKYKKEPREGSYLIEMVWENGVDLTTVDGVAILAEFELAPKIQEVVDFITEKENGSK